MHRGGKCCGASGLMCAKIGSTWKIMLHTHQIVRYTNDLNICHNFGTWGLGDALVASLHVHVASIRHSMRGGEQKGTDTQRLLEDATKHYRWMPQIAYSRRRGMILMQGRRLPAEVDVADLGHLPLAASIQAGGGASAPG